MTSTNRLNDNLKRHVKFLEEMRDNCLREQKRWAHELTLLHANAGPIRRTWDAVVRWFVRIVR